MARQARARREGPPPPSTYGKKLARWKQESLSRGEEEPADIAPAAIAPVTDTRKTGTVKWFDAQRGFGFIMPESGGRDVFVHTNDVARAGLATLDAGQQVSYDLGQDKGRGPPAINLALVTS